MCLDINHKKTKRDTYIYKVFRVESGGLHAPIQSAYYKPGLNKPDKIIRVYSNTKNIFGGAIHAFTSLKTAQEFKNSSEIIIRFKIKKDNIIAFGKDNDIAIRRLNINKKLYEQIISNYKRPIFYKG